LVLLFFVAVLLDSFHVLNIIFKTLVFGGGFLRRRRGGEVYVEPGPTVIIDHGDFGHHGGYGGPDIIVTHSHGHGHNYGDSGFTSGGNQYGGYTGGDSGYSGYTGGDGGYSGGDSGYSGGDGGSGDFGGGGNEY
jgi:hypothetical protein